MPTVRAIINADDLGLDARTNEAIFTLMAKGRVTSSTILANAPAVEEAARRSREFPHCSFGVHLNASEFEPLTGRRGLAPLLDERGALHEDPRRVHLDARLVAAIHDEWVAQIDRVRALGVEVRHLDSHHHVHTTPRLFPVLAALKKRFGIRTIRVTQNLFPLAHPFPRLHRLKKQAWTLALRHYIGARTTDMMGDLGSFVEHAAEMTTDCAVEIMVHPGNAGYADEEQTLHSEWWAGLPFKLRPVSFDEL